MADPTGTTSAQLVRLMTNARVRLPGATDVALQNEIFNVLDDFLRGSAIWTEDVDFQTNATDIDFDIIASSGQILSLVKVLNSSAIPVSAVMPIPGTIELALANSQIETFTATVTKTIVDPIARDGFPVLDDWILVKYLPVLTDGLVGRMMAQAAKPYSSPQASLYLVRFGTGIAMATADRLHAHTQGAQRWRFPRFR